MGDFLIGAFAVLVGERGGALLCLREDLNTWNLPGRRVGQGEPIGRGLLQVLELSGDTLIAFVSDSHVGRDPGCDGFESPAQLEALFEEVRDHEGPVELILAGDLFDFLQISEVPEGMDRASLTMSRPEYRDLFVALKRFREDGGGRVTYLPGNHDAESFWNPEIQKTLRAQGLVYEFAFYYLASIEVGGERRITYCETASTATSSTPRTPSRTITTGWTRVWVITS